MKLNITLTDRFTGFTLKALLATALVAGSTVAQAQTTYTWDGSEGDNSWSNAQNWTPARALPDSADFLVFNGNATVNVDFALASEAIDKIEIGNNANVVFSVASSKTLALGKNVGPNLLVRPSAKLTVTNSVSGASLQFTIPSPNTKFARIDGILEFAGSAGAGNHQIIGGATNSIRVFGTFIAGSGSTGNPFGSGGVANSAQLKAGSTYVNQAGGSPFGTGTSVTWFDPTSEYVHQSAAAIDLAGRNYGNVVIDYPGYSAMSTGTGAASFYNLTVNQAGSFTLAHEGVTNIRGNVAVNNGELTISPQSLPYNTFFRGTALQTVTSAGNGKVIFGNNCRVNIEAGNQVQLGTNITVRQQMNVYGLIDMQHHVISSDQSTGTFVLVSGGALYTSHPEGINLRGTAGGAVQVPGNRQYNTGTYKFYGTTPQHTGNGLPATLNILTIENSEGVTLDRSVVVLNQLNLFSGLFYTSSANLPTVDQLGVISGQSETSYIHGPVAKIVPATSTAPLLFPIGKSEYRPVELALEHSATESATVTYTAEQFNGAVPVNFLLPSSLMSVSQARYYSISKSTIAPLNTGKITIPARLDDGLNVHHVDLRIAKSDGITPGSNWIDIGGAYDQVEASITSTINFEKFSYFAMASTSTPLPVSLISLDAIAQKENVLVKWATSKEEHNDYFEVQRSNDGVNFHTIGKVVGMGNSNNRNNYAYTDMQPLTGLAYYRLRQVDYDGTASLHGPVAVRMAGGSIGQLALYPNPAVNVATLSFEAEADQVATLRVVNTIGQTVAQQTVPATKGYNTVSIPAEKLATGMYVIEMITATGTTATRLIKQ